MSGYEHKDQSEGSQDSWVLFLLQGSIQQVRTREELRGQESWVSFPALEALRCDS